MLSEQFSPPYSLQGKLSYCHAPPGVDGREFNTQFLPGFVGGGALETGGAISRRGEHSVDIDKEADHTRNHCLGEFDTRYFQQVSGMVNVRRLALGE